MIKKGFLKYFIFFRLSNPSLKEKFISSGFKPNLNKKGYSVANPLSIIAPSIYFSLFDIT